jgi:hypothetical protein
MKLEAVNTDQDDFRNRKAALVRLATMVASLIKAGGYDDLFGYDIDRELTEKQVERLDWAIDEVVRRLYRMGGG